MATALETSSAITAELEQFYADAEATQDFADDALLDWLDGSLTGFEADQPRDPQQEVREPSPRLRKNPPEHLTAAKLHLAARVVTLNEPHGRQPHALGSEAARLRKRCFVAIGGPLPPPPGINVRPHPMTPWRAAL